MNYLSSLGSLDDLSTPVIICDNRGIVTYKNKMAMREIRLPRRNTHIERHVLQADKAAFLSIGKSRNACVVGIDTGDRPARAFVVPYLRSGTPCTLWVFVSVIQVFSTNRYTYLIENDITCVASQICKLVKSIDENSTAVKSKSSNTFGIRMLEKIKKVISYIFYNSDDIYISLEKCVNMLVKATDLTFKKFGYNINYSIAGGLEIGANYIDMRSLSLVFFHLMAFFAECGAERSMNVVISSFESKMDIKLTLTLPYPPFYGEGNDPMVLAGLSPKNTVDAIIFSRLCEVKNYQFSYCINEDHLNNMTVYIDVPLKKRAKLRDLYFAKQLSSLDETVLFGDIVALYLNMLKYRNFNPEDISLE